MYYVLVTNKRKIDTMLQFYFEALPRDITPKTSVRILGLYLTLYGPESGDVSLLDIGVFISQLRVNPPQRLPDDKIVIVFEFDDPESLQESLERQPIILDHQAEPYNYVFISDPFNWSDDIVALDPITCQPTGKLPSVFV